jgi:prepilin-type N-terminal cleavage/methylation domain-containing protein
MSRVANRAPEGRRRDRRKGFTLIEAVVAMAVAAMGFIGLYQVLSGAARLDRSAQDIQSMTLVAESVLAQTPHMPPGQSVQGEEAGFSWSLTATGDPAMAGLSRIRVEVVSALGQRIVLRSARPSEPPQESGEGEDGEERRGR